jgi:hypothetical protein
MADIALTPNWSAPAIARRPDWLGALGHRAEVLRRLARRSHYLALTGRSPVGYRWFETLFTNMSGR